MKSCSIVIVNWNSGNQLKECINSINHTKKTMFVFDKIIIVDNASLDDSLKNILIPQLEIEIIRNKRNFGFAKACNAGAVKASSDFVLFLNPDTLLYEDTLDMLFGVIDENVDTDIGIYGVQLKDDTGEIQKTCARFPGVWNFFVRSLGLNKINSKVFQSYTMHDWDHKESMVVDEVMGAFFMVKVDLFEKLNGFDEDFFVYYEELDFAKRSFDIGFKAKYLVESQAFHKGGGVSQQVKAERLFYNLHSRIIYSFKHFGKLNGIFVMFLTLFVEPFTRLIYLIMKKNKKEIPELALGYKMLFEKSFFMIKKVFSK